MDPAPSIVDLATRCRALAGAGAGALAWEWDGLFQAALSAFDSALADAVSRDLAVAFAGRFTAESIASAPDGVRAIARGHGGLRPGQALWIHGDEHPRLFCAWWPWNGGARISIRVGLVENAELTAANAETALRAWFGLAPRA